MADRKVVSLHSELQKYLMFGPMPNDDAAGMPGSALNTINSLRELVGSHPNEVRSYVIGLNIIADVLVFLKSRYMSLATAVVRFITAVVGQHNAAYARYLVQSDAINTVITGWWRRDGDLDAQLMAVVREFDAAVNADTAIPAAKKELGM